MKAAIYSRVMEEEQQKDVQVFFDELAKQKIEPVIWQHFFEQIKDRINLPADTKTFPFPKILQMKLNLSSAWEVMEHCWIL